MMKDIECPKISIVTPSFNQGIYLEEAICSVLEQDYSNTEYIIIDGESTDNSLEIIKKYEQHLAYWVSEPDKGQAHAINKGFAKVTGEIFAFLNSDDLYEPGCLQRVAEDFTKDHDKSWHVYPVLDFMEQGLNAKYFNRLANIEKVPVNLYVDSHEFKLGDFPYSHNSLLNWVLRRVHIHQPGVFWSCDLIKETGGFDENYHFNFDRKIFMDLISRKHFPVIHSGNPVVRFRLHPESKTINSENVTENQFVLEEIKISEEFEKMLPFRERFIAMQARADNLVAGVWEMHRKNHNPFKCLLRLFALPYKLPVILLNRFYLGTVRKMIMQYNTLSKP